MKNLKIVVHAAISHHTRFLASLEMTGEGAENDTEKSESIEIAIDDNEMSTLP